MFFAHSGKNRDKSDWQLLKPHLEAVAELAGAMARIFGCERAAYLIGLLHDLGKYALAMQRRLEGAEIRVDHSTAGGWHALQALGGKDRFMAELIGYVVLGHHAGLPDMRGTDASLTSRIERFDPGGLDPAWQSELDLHLTDLAPPFDWQAQSRERLAFQVAFLGRMLFSCLVDADFKDTEAFYSGLDGPQPDRVWPELADLLPAFITAFDGHMAMKARTDDALNRLRSDILSHVRGKAIEAPGLFTLTVPTGGGKTLASLGFALDHARIHGHRRIIYAIPFTGAWIETAMPSSPCLPPSVAPSRERGSKQDKTLIGRHEVRVAPSRERGSKRRRWNDLDRCRVRRSSPRAVATAFSISSSCSRILVISRASLI